MSNIFLPFPKASSDNYRNISSRNNATHNHGFGLPLMNRQETEHYTMQTVFRASTWETFENKIGKQRYAIAVYEKLIRATIPIIIIGAQDDKDDKPEKKQQQQQKEQNSKWFYLLISFDLGSDVISIMEDKILPLIEQFRKGSLIT